MNTANPFSRQHGGADALGVAQWDFSTNSNACGPCPIALQRVREADARHYPDPEYRALRKALAAWHGVEESQVLLGASASELIHRIHVWARLNGIAAVCVPSPAYGDYAQQACALGLSVQQRAVQGDSRETTTQPALQWACSPASPTGLADPILTHWQQHAGCPMLRFLDAAYAPLVLACDQDWRAQAMQRQSACWQLFSPNKSLGLTGVRAAYAIVPRPTHTNEARTLRTMLESLHALAPSWPLGAHGVALLQAWMEEDVQTWLAQSRTQLTQYQHAQIALCETLGWRVLPGSLANYFVAQPLPQLHDAWACGDLPLPQAQATFSALLQRLRQADIKLRDTASMDLPLHVRLSAQPPDAQRALELAWSAIQP